MRYLPICTSSPSSSLAFSTRRRFTYVPFRLPSSSIVAVVAAADERVPARDGYVVEEDLALGRATDRDAVALECERLAGAATARHARRAQGPRCEGRPASESSSPSSSGVKVIVVCDPGSSRMRSAPHFEQ